MHSWIGWNRMPRCRYTGYYISAQGFANIFRGITSLNHILWRIILPLWRIYVIRRRTKAAMFGSINFAITNVNELISGKSSLVFSIKSSQLIRLDPFKSIRSPHGFERAYKNACLRWQSYPLHVARVQMINDLKLKKATANPASQKFASSIGVDSTAMYRELSLNEIIRLVVGIASSDQLEKLPKGSLDALKAHNFHKAPFRLDLTDDLSRHLTFRESSVGDRPTLLLLSPRGLVSIFNIQYAGLFTYPPLSHN
jgi:hypothetical protein